MHRLIYGIIAAVVATSVGYGQTTKPPIPPCGLQGEPTNAPCIDLKTGKLYHTDSFSSVPKISTRPSPLAAPPPTSSKPVTIPKLTAPTPPKAIPAQKWTPPQPPEIQQNVEVNQKVQVNTTNPYTEQMRENYQTGQQIGNALGGLIYRLRVQHAIKKACSKGARGWTLPNGTTVWCHNGTAASSPEQERSAPATSGSTEWAQKSYTMMEGLREDIIKLRNLHGGGPVQAAIQESTSSWDDMKGIYCQEVPNGKYTDLEGKEQSCTAGN